MAEMLVRTVNKTASILGTVNPPPEVLAMRMQKGDVITIQDDDWAWSPAERNNPEWAIVKAPGVAVDDLVAFLTADSGDAVQGILARRRAFNFNVDQWIGRGKPVLTLATAMDHKRKHARLVHPDVLGTTDDVIG
jgi:hypothetical protein